MGIGPDPVGKGLLDQGLLALSDGCLLPVQDCGTFAILVFEVVKNTDVLEVQRLLHDLIAVDPACAVGAAGLDVPGVIGFALNVPLAGVFGVADMDVPLAISRCGEELEHKLFHNFRRQPGGAETDGDFRRCQVSGLNALQGFHIDRIICGAQLRALPGLP